MRCCSPVLAFLRHRSAAACPDAYREARPRKKGAAAARPICAAAEVKLLAPIRADQPEAFIDMNDRARCRVWTQRASTRPVVRVRAAARESRCRFNMRAPAIRTAGRPRRERNDLALKGIVRRSGFTIGTGIDAWPPSNGPWAAAPAWTFQGSTCSHGLLTGRWCIALAGDPAVTSVHF